MRTASARVAIVFAAAAIWFAVPSFAAAGLALDRPAWADPDDGTDGTRVEKKTSWYPPGVRYEWTGRESGARRVVVDPWEEGALAGPLLWTGFWLVAVVMADRLLVRS